MRMRLPGSGSFLDSVFSTGDDTGGEGYSREDPTPDELGEALASMRSGHIEFVILEADDGTFVQAAGSGDTGYALERWAGGEPTYMVVTADFASVTDALATFLAGDASAGLPQSVPAGFVANPAPPKKRRWFGRG